VEKKRGNRVFQLIFAKRGRKGQEKSSSGDTLGKKRVIPHWVQGEGMTVSSEKGKKGYDRPPFLHREKRRRGRKGKG